MEFISSDVFEDLESVRLGTNGHSEVFRMPNGYYVKTEPSPSEQPNGIQSVMFKRGFPVPEIVAAGNMPDGKQYIAITNMGPTFEYIEAANHINEKDFEPIIQVVRTWTATQLQHQAEAGALTPLEALYVDELSQEVVDNIPGPRGQDLAAAIDSIKPKLGARLSRLPAAYNHGDFVPRNMTRSGVIDLEFAHIGTFGFDTISALFHAYMFPEKTGAEDEYQFEATREATFSPEQLTRAMALLDTDIQLNGNEPFSEYIDDLILAKLIWSSGDDPGRPQLVQWRYRALHECIKAYQSDKPLAVANTLVSLTDQFERTRREAITDFQNAAQTIYGDDLAYGFIAGRIARSQGFVSPKSDIDMIVIDKQPNTVQRQQMQEAYADIHRRHFLTPDEQWGCEQFSEIELIERMKEAYAAEPIAHIESTDVTLYDGIILASMHAGAVTGLIGDESTFWHNRRLGTTIRSMWLNVIGNPENAGPLNRQIKNVLTFEGDYL